jgi:eukaryotic-like serine/threonine-protein kinase
MAANLIGRKLLGGEYELLEVLGVGGMATVYRASSRSLETDVAIKVLAPRLASDPNFRERFHDEARSLAHLHHPNLIEVHHYGEEGDLVYIVMRMVPGGTLKDRLQALEGPLDLTSTARVVGQVADALQDAHDQGLVHLDIKPANILLGRVDWPLLADFGITRAVGREGTGHGGERMAGTPLYMSPEQCRGGPVDGSSDQYSLAVTAFELLTGHWPFVAETTEVLLQRQIEDTPPRPRGLNPGIPGPVEDVLLRGLAKTPEDRYPTIKQFASALTSAVEAARGVTLETKAALAGAAPHLLGVLALVLLGPLLLGIVPETPILVVKSSSPGPSSSCWPVSSPGGCCGYAGT